MLSEIFYWIVNISIIGGAAGLAVLMLRKIKALPRFAAYALWMLPFIRLWLPFGIANEYSLLDLISRFTTKTVVILNGSPGFTATNIMMGANSYFPIEYKTETLEKVFGIASVVWIIVCCAAILTSLSLYFFTRSELKTAKHMKDNIYISDRISAPAVYGVFRPKMILPAAMEGGDTEYIVMHEQVHVSRRDNLLRIAAVITACVYWFDPLSWIFLKCFFADMELACDAKVMKRLNEDQKKAYARAILSCASGKTLFASAFGGAKTRVRIENILSYKKITALSALFYAVLLGIIAVVIITNANA